MLTLWNEVGVPDYVAVVFKVPAGQRHRPDLRNMMLSAQSDSRKAISPFCSFHDRFSPGSAASVSDTGTSLNLEIDLGIYVGGLEADLAEPGIDGVETGPEIKRVAGTRLPVISCTR